MNKILLLILGFFSLFTGAFAADQNSPVEIQRTLSIIKPDAVAGHHIGAIINRFENENLFVIGAKMMQLSIADAQEFYGEHKDRAFYNDLIKYMTSGPIFVQVLEGINAVARNREIMGATNPQKAALNTLRAKYGTSIEKNAVHGSDSVESAKREIAFFFSEQEIFTK